MSLAWANYSILVVRNTLKYIARGVITNEFYNLSYVNKHTCVIFLLLFVQISILAPKYENAQNAKVAALTRGTSVFLKDVFFAHAR